MEVSFSKTQLTYPVTPQNTKIIGRNESHLNNSVKKKKTNLVTNYKAFKIISQWKSPSLNFHQSILYLLVKNICGNKITKPKLTSEPCT